MISATEAEQIILTLADPIAETETLNLRAASDGPTLAGRVLAEAISSKLDFPHWDNSAMDGYAVRSADVSSAPVTLQIIETIAAGQIPRQTVSAGQAARIFTGAMLPGGADAIVMQENTTREGDRVDILQAVEPGKFVRQQGSFANVGTKLIEQGARLDAPEIGLLAAAQQTQIQVYRRPRVAILSTGNELVSITEELGAGQIVDSNQYALTTLVAEAGAEPIIIGRVEDSREGLKDAIAQALSTADIILSTGGVSVGDFDYVDEVLEALGADIKIHSVAVKPGKPLTVAAFGETEQTPHRRRTLYFGLPGNPASAMVGFWRFVKSAIAKTSGQTGPWIPEFIWATAQSDLTAGGRRETYLWGQLEMTDTGFGFRQAIGSHLSANLVNWSNVTGLGVVPQGERLVAAGERIRVLKIR